MAGSFDLLPSNKEDPPILFVCLFQRRYGRGMPGVAEQLRSPNCNSSELPGRNIPGAHNILILQNIVPGHVSESSSMGLKFCDRDCSGGCSRGFRICSGGTPGGLPSGAIPWSVDRVEKTRLVR